MRQRLTCWWALMALLLCGCQEIDAFEPIDLVVGDGLDATQEQAVGRAARCWNLGFGTKMKATRTPVEEQQVPVEVTPLACMEGNGGITVSVPRREMHICPGIEKPSNFFGMIVHELGHVLNIWEHVDDDYAVMNPSSAGGPMQVFTDTDRRAFEEANGPLRTNCAKLGLSFFSGECVCLVPLP